MMLVVGAGRIGQALAQKGAELISARDLLRFGTQHPRLKDHDVVLHAAGPAGERACLEDPAMAFATHYTLLDMLCDWCVADPKRRRVMVLGTVAPDVGFYGPLKRAAIANARRHLFFVADTINKIAVIECGQVIGEGSSDDGVVAQFVRASLRGQGIRITGDGKQMIRYTPLTQLIDVVRGLYHEWPKAPSVLSPVSEPISVLDVARLCLDLAVEQSAALRNSGTSNVIFYETPPPLNTPPNYARPTGERLPVAPLADVLRPWMQTMNVT